MYTSKVGRGLSTLSRHGLCHLIKTQGTGTKPWVARLSKPHGKAFTTSGGLDQVWALRL